jgi:predicted Rossmann-fold nucleotide-binding protein
MAMQPKAVIVAGGRNFVPEPEHYIWLQEQLRYQMANLVITGGQSGADAFGHSVAVQMGIRCLIVPARWSRYGDRAGPIRNEEMADRGKLLIAFPGGDGTKNMCDIMIKQKKKIIYYENPLEDFMNSTA